LTEHCYLWDGTRKATGLKRIGKYFCSEDHAEQYGKRKILSEISHGTDYSSG